MVRQALKEERKAAKLAKTGKAASATTAPKASAPKVVAGPKVAPVAAPAASDVVATQVGASSLLLTGTNEQLAYIQRVLGVARALNPTASDADLLMPMVKELSAKLRSRLDAVLAPTGTG